MHTPLSLLFGLVACTSLLASGPDTVVRDYFKAISAERSDEVRGYVSKDCQTRPLAKGAPGKVLFVPVEYTRLDVALVSESADRALVAYEYEGQARGKKVDETVDVLGTKVDVKIDGVEVGSVTRSGEFELVKEGGAWKIGC